MKDFNTLVNENFVNPDGEENTKKKSKFLEYYTEFSKIYTEFNAYYIENYSEIGEKEERELYSEVLKKMSRLDNSMKNVMGYHNGDYIGEENLEDTGIKYKPTEVLGDESDTFQNTEEE